MTDPKDVIICRCEEVSRAEIEEAIADGAQSLAGIKTRTHAGMGLCQGRTCRRLITQMLVQATGQKPENLAPFTTRSPVRTACIEEFLHQEEDEACENTQM